MPVTNPKKEFDAYFKLDTREGNCEIAESVKQKNGDWEAEPRGSRMEGDLKAIIPGFYEHKGQILSTLSFVFYYIKSDGGVGKEKLNMGLNSVSINILNTLASMENIDGIGLGLEFWPKVSEADGETYTQCSIEINGQKVVKDDPRGIKWKFSYDKLKPMMSNDDKKERHDQFVAFFDKNIKPLFEKGVVEGGTDYGKLELAEVLAGQNPKSEERPEMMKEMAAADQLMNDEDSPFDNVVDDGEDELPF